MSSNTESSAAKNWTRDAAGNFVDWTKPPYRDGSLLHLVLEGEDPAKIPSSVRTQRIREYYLLTWRAAGMKSAPRARGASRDLFDESVTRV